MDETPSDKKPPGQKNHIHPHRSLVSALGNKDSPIRGLVGSFIPICRGDGVVRVGCLALVGIIGRK